MIRPEFYRLLIVQYWHNSHLKEGLCISVSMDRPAGPWSWNISFFAATTVGCTRPSLRPQYWGCLDHHTWKVAAQIPTIQDSYLPLRSRDAKLRQCCFNLCLSHSSPTERSLKSLAISRQCRIFLAMASCSLMLPTLHGLHPCSPLLSLWSLRKSHSTGQLVETGAFQFRLTASRTPDSLGQKLSKWKGLFFWIWTLRPSVRGSGLKPLLTHFVRGIQEKVLSSQSSKKSVKSHKGRRSSFIGPCVLATMQLDFLRLVTSRELQNLPINALFRLELFLSAAW